jgi:flavodoxin I
LAQIGLFFGSTDGHTAAIAQQVKAILDAALGDHGQELVELFDVADFYLEEMVDFDYLILGVPTWNTGQLQRDWERVFVEFDTLDLAGKRVALFGLGDQVGYPDTFADALFFVADKVRTCGATLVGTWPASGYHFSASWACAEGCFVGLVLDEHNQPELTQARLNQWLAQLGHEFGMGDQLHWD